MYSSRREPGQGSLYSDSALLAAGIGAASANRLVDDKLLKAGINVLKQPPGDDYAEKVYRGLVHAAEIHKRSDLRLASLRKNTQTAGLKLNKLPYFDEYPKIKPVTSFGNAVKMVSGTGTQGYNPDWPINVKLERMYSASARYDGMGNATLVFPALTHGRPEVAAHEIGHLTFKNKNPRLAGWIDNVNRYVYSEKRGPKFGRNVNLGLAGLGAGAAFIDNDAARISSIAALTAGAGIYGLRQMIPEISANIHGRRILKQMYPAYKYNAKAILPGLASYFIPGLKIAAMPAAGYLAARIGQRFWNRFHGDN